jgi:hypothetical protein
MTATYEKIETTTLGSAASSVTFSTIPGTYTDLVIIIAATQSSPNTCGIRFNGDTGSNYSATRLGADGSSALSNRWSNVTSAYTFVQYTTQNSTIMNIQNYSNTTTYKTVLSRFNNAANFLGTYVALWRSTAAITSLSLQDTDGTTNFATGSTFTLYGIKAE